MSRPCNSDTPPIAAPKSRTSPSARKRIAQDRSRQTLSARPPQARGPDCRLAPVQEAAPASRQALQRNGNAANQAAPVPGIGGDRACQQSTRPEPSRHLHAPGARHRRPARGSGSLRRGWSWPGSALSGRTGFSQSQPGGIHGSPRAQQAIRSFSGWVRSGNVAQPQAVGQALGALGRAGFACGGRFCGRGHGWIMAAGRGLGNLPHPSPLGRGSETCPRESGGLVAAGWVPSAA